MKVSILSIEYFSVIGYGTFITRGHWKDKLNVEPCLVTNFSRVYPQGYWFPIVFPSKESFWALKFEVTQQELEDLDNYEGVNDDLFKRIEIYVKLKSGEKTKAFLYVPTDNLISTNKLHKGLDTSDRWKDHIRKFPEIVKLFPELIL